MEDLTLPLPDLPALDHPLGPLDFALRQPLAGDAPFRLSGRAATVAGGARRGLDEVRVGGVRVAGRVGIRGVVGDAAILTPLGMERRVGPRAGGILERVVVPRDGGGCVLEWIAEEGDARVDIGWDAPAHRWRAFDRGLVVAAAEGPPAAFVLSEAPEALEVADAAEAGHGSIRVTARVRLRAGVPLRLAVAAGEGGSLGRTLAALARSGLTRALRGQADRARRELLSLDAPDPERVREVAWAACRAQAGIGGAGGPAGAGEGPGAALEALAAGAFSVARDALVARGRGEHADVAAAPWVYLLLAARYLAWTGDLSTLRREWPGILALRAAVEARERARGEGEAAEGAPDAAQLRGAALAELADAAESIGERGQAAELRRSAEERGGGPWSIELGAGEGDGAALRRVAHGLLGAEPDAPRGRLVLRPAPPPGWEWFRVSRLRLGDAAVAVEYERTGARHAFRLRQDQGGAPVRVILEPGLSGARLLSARVDGVPAQLDARPAGDKLVVPVQVVLDHPREVVLELDTRMERERRQA